MAIIVNGRPYELLTVVCKQLGVSRIVLYRATRLGRLPYIAVAGRRFVDLEAAQQYVATKYRRKTAEAIKRAWARRKRLQAKAEEKSEVNEESGGNNAATVAQ